MWINKAKHINRGLIQYHGTYNCLKSIDTVPYALIKCYLNSRCFTRNFTKSNEKKTYREVKKLKATCMCKLNTYILIFMLLEMFSHIENLHVITLKDIQLTQSVG